MADLRVRVYNVRFGDAILVRVPDRDPATGVTATRHVLIDVGNVLGKEGGDDGVFAPIVQDVLKQLKGRPLDLYVMTHEHLDHVQGLFHAAANAFPEGTLLQKLAVRHAWLTASAAPDYYERHPEAKKALALHLAMYERIERHLRAAPEPERRAFRILLANNNPKSTAACVAFLRSLAAKTTYVHRGVDLSGAHPFAEARFEVWGPEEDTASYYGKLQPLLLGASPNGGPPRAPVIPEPPPGVDAGAFYDLVLSRSLGIADNLLAIDKAKNDTSVVFLLSWRGWKLLFSGDAELRSWRMMAAQGALGPVHFLKVSHHGSHNGTPHDDLLDRVFPQPPPDARRRRAVISTWPDTYSGIPHEPTNERLRRRAHLVSTVDDRTRPWVDLRFRG